MPEVYGTGDFRYNFVENWAKLPAGMSFKECPGVAVDSNDNVFVLTRGEEPIIVLDRDGNYIRSFGKGDFRPTEPTDSTSPTTTHSSAQMTAYIPFKSSALPAKNCSKSASVTTPLLVGAVNPSIALPQLPSIQATATSMCQTATVILGSTSIPEPANTSFHGAHPASMQDNSSVPTISP